MFFDEAVLTDIDSVLEAEQVGDFALGTLTKAHLDTMTDYKAYLCVRKRLQRTKGRNMILGAL